MSNSELIHNDHLVFNNIGRIQDDYCLEAITHTQPIEEMGEVHDLTYEQQTQHMISSSVIHDASPSLEPINHTSYVVPSTPLVNYGHSTSSALPPNFKSLPLVSPIHRLVIPPKHSIETNELFSLNKTNNLILPQEEQLHYNLNRVLTSSIGYLQTPLSLIRSLSNCFRGLRSTVYHPQNSLHSNDFYQRSLRQTTNSVHTTKPSMAKQAYLSPADFYYRPIQLFDTDQLIQLHTEWFPLNYDESFFLSVSSGRVFSLAAIYNSTRNDTNHLTESTKQSSNSTCQEYIAGLITISQTIGAHLRYDDIDLIMKDIQHDDRVTISSSYSTNYKYHMRHQASSSNEHTTLNPTAASDTPSSFIVNQQLPVAYILTLGVAEGFRGIGLASELLHRSQEFFLNQNKNMVALYLHVACYNTSAICLYEKLGFKCIQHVPAFYNIEGNQQDALLYVLYF